MYNVEQRIKGFDRQEHHAEVCVVGGGLAGLCAAVSAARGGAKTVLIHDRPVLGGNASSEVRMWVVGAQHYGGADYLKNNHPGKQSIENWTLERMRSLPGKRVNFRYVGDHGQWGKSRPWQPSVGVPTSWRDCARSSIPPRKPKEIIPMESEAEIGDPHR